MTEQRAEYNSKGGNMNEKNAVDGELVVAGNQALSDFTDDLLVSAERRIHQIEKIKMLALKTTNANDWVDQQGKPYLAGSGAEKVARLFGVSWKILKNEKVNSTDEKGTFYFYMVTGVFTMAGGKIDSVEAVGTCSSKDQFFAKCKGELKPISEVDETNIMKAAYTNCVANGITRLLGIRNLTWEQLGAAGISKDGVAKVNYANGGAGGGLISEAQCKRFYAIAKGSGKTDEQIKAYIKTKYKIESTKEIKKEVYEEACKWAEIAEVGQ